MKRLVALMLTLLVNAATAAPSVTTSTAPGSLVSASGVKDSAKNVLTPDCQKAHGDLDAAQAKKQQADADIQKAKTELSKGQSQAMTDLQAGEAALKAARSDEEKAQQLLRAGKCG